MGIPGILKEIGKGERVALTKFAVEHFEKTNRPLRIAIDAAIWNFQNAAGQGGRNPALRTLFFRLLKILALPIHPVFVYDGPKKPLTKRGKTVTRYGSCVENEMAKQLLSVFKFPSHTAPGEAEAECALLQKRGIVDAVMSQDVDAIMFGSTVTLRDWSKEGTRGNKTPTHVSILESVKVKERSGLDPDAMILVALLSGGDYDEGIAGFGSGLACEIARAGFGTDLLRLLREDDTIGLGEWRERLNYELESNESGYFRCKHRKLTIPESFPNLTILEHYTNPNVSKQENLQMLESTWVDQWAAEIDIPILRKYTATMFDWNWKPGARRFVRCFAQPLFQDRLCRGVVQHSIYDPDNITEDRRHFVNDGIVELRFSAVPADIVGIDIEAEDDSPEYLARQAAPDNSGEDEEDEDDVQNNEISTTGVSSQGTELQSPSKKKSPPWDPFTVEKWWIPATLLKIGLGSVVEEWEQKQRDVAADPKKFATRKCAKKPKAATRIDGLMKPDAIRSFLITTKSQDCAPTRIGKEPTQTENHLSEISSILERAPRTPSKRRHQMTKEATSPSIKHFFRPRKPMEPPTLFQDAKGIPKKNPTPAVSTGFAKIAKSSPRPNRSPDKTLLLEAKQRADASLTVNAIVERPPMSTVPTADIFSDVFDDSNITRRSQHEQHRPWSWHRATEEGDFKSSAKAFVHSTFVTGQSDTIKYVSSDEAESQTAVPSKLNALPRDSLPGTWKEFCIEDNARRRPARISYVDLTGD